MRVEFDPETAYLAVIDCACGASLDDGRLELIESSAPNQMGLLVREFGRTTRIELDRDRSYELADALRGYWDGSRPVRSEPTGSKPCVPVQCPPVEEQWVFTDDLTRDDDT